MARRQILLDTDVGIDDALMIISVVAEPDADLVAIGSCHGNCDERQAALNAIRVLDVLDMTDIPVAIGEPSSLADPIEALNVHGQDGLGDANVPGPSRKPSAESAVDQMLRLSREHPGLLDLVAVGALTNLAAALERDESVLSRFRSVWTLGGYARRPEGEDAESEDFNTFTSPKAADRVFGSTVALNVVPIDTTFRVIFSDAQLGRIAAGTTPAARLVSAILPCYLDFHSGRFDRRTIPVHDPVVPAVLFHPELIRATERKPIIVEPRGDLSWSVGVGPAEDGHPSDRAPATIVTEVDSACLLDRLVGSIVTPLGQLTPL